jgi:hypothetical protein
MKRCRCECGREQSLIEWASTEQHRALRELLGGARPGGFSRRLSVSLINGLSANY